MLTLTHQY